MKKLFVSLIAVMILQSGMAIAEVKQEASKFKMEYTVIYNSVTLEEAAKIEMRVKKENKDACSVSVNSLSSNGTLYFNTN